MIMPTVSNRLIDSVDFAHLIIDNFTNATLVLSVDFSILHFNKVAEKLFDCTKESVLGKNLIDICKKKNIIPPVSENVKDFLKDRPNNKLELAMQSPVGHVILRWNIMPLVYGEDHVLLLIGEDITSYKRLELREKNLHAYLDNILTHIPCFIYWKDKQSVYLGCNEMFALAAGLNSAEEIVGKTDYELAWAHSEGDLFRLGDQEVLEGHAKLNFEESQLQADGKIATVLASKVPMRSKDGKIIGILGIYLDISDRKRAELALIEEKKKAEAANRSKTEFLAVMGHELRTPLNSIIGMAQLLQLSDLPVEEHAKADIIFQAGITLLELINNVLDVTRGDIGKINLVIERFNLLKLVDSVFSMLSQQAREKGIALEMAEQHILDRYFYGDVARIRQVLLNLISNSLKFTVQGKIIVSAEYKTQLTIIVQDTGIGIPEDKLEYIFECFTQVDSSYSRPYSGMGLGLWITKNLVKLMRGNIEVKSQIGKGSIFLVTLPLDVG